MGLSTIAWAASRIASERVGWGNIVFANSNAVPSKIFERDMPHINSLTLDPIACTPNISPCLSSEIIFKIHLRIHHL